MLLSEYFSTRLILSICSLWIHLYLHITLQHIAEFNNSKSALGILVKSLTNADIVFGLACFWDCFRVWLLELWSPDLPSLCWMCHVVSFSLGASLGIAMLTVGAISFDRFYALLYPERYAVVCTQRKGRLFVLILYVGCGVLFLLPLAFGGDDQDRFCLNESCISHWDEYSSGTSFFALTVLYLFSMVTCVKCSFCVSQACLSGKFAHFDHRISNDRIDEDDCNNNPTHCQPVEIDDSEYKTTQPQLSGDTAKARTKSRKVKNSQSTHHLQHDFNKRTATTFHAATVIFFIAWLACILVIFQRSFSIKRSSSLLGSVINIGLFSSALLKPAIYVGCLREFRRGVVDVFFMLVYRCVDCVKEPFICDQV